MAPARKTKKRTGKEADTSRQSRTRISQEDVPSFGLEKALRIPQVLVDNFAKQSARPLQLANALDIKPTSSNFRMLCGASIAYGLTSGGYNAEAISLQPLGKRIASPTVEGDDMMARREAVLRPRVFREFLTKYDGSRLPSPQIAQNMLQEMGVPRERAEEVYQFIIESAKLVGFIVNIKGADHVDLKPAGAAVTSTSQASLELVTEIVEGKPLGESLPTEEAMRPGAVDTGRVFITHGKNREIVEQLKTLLTFGKFTPVVSVERETVSKPVPDKVMDDMRSCTAAVIHVDAEQILLDDEGQPRRLLNSNVLIEIGAALALYGRKFILLVRNGVDLPSNLKGLYEVRYEGDKLDYDATMRLLNAFNDFRTAK